METEVEKKGIGKPKIGLVVSGVLIVILAISSLWLYTRIDSLQSQVNTLQTDKDYLQTQINTLQCEYDNYVATHHYSDSEYNETQFSFYYVKPEEQKFGVYDLEDELYGLEWLHSYQEGVFDCSDMSAYLERHLENEGWNAIIVAGDSPFGSGRHAWLLVEASTDQYMPIESTNIEVVWWSNPDFDDYFIYDYEFETIQEAIAYNENEFDWWKSP